MTVISVPLGQEDINSNDQISTMGASFYDFLAGSSPGPDPLSAGVADSAAFQAVGDNRQCRAGPFQGDYHPACKNLEGI